MSVTCEECQFWSPWFSKDVKPVRGSCWITLPSWIRNLDNDGYGTATSAWDGCDLGKKVDDVDV